MKKIWPNSQISIRKKLLLLLFLIPILYNSCSSVKPTTTKSGKSYFETFYVGTEGTQYFIKPLSLKNNKTKETLLMDMTFRYKDQIKDSSIVNFSIKSPKLYKSADSLEITTKTTHIKADKVKLLFNEKSGDDFISRFTAKIPLRKIKEMFDRDDWTFTLHHPTQIKVYETDKKTAKSIAALRKKVFILM